MSFVSLSLACSANAADDEENGGDEGALAGARAGKATILGSAKSVVGGSVSWSADSSGRTWLQNHEERAFGPAGKPPIYKIPKGAPGWRFGGATVNGETVTLMVEGMASVYDAAGAQADSIVRFDTAGPNVTTIVPVLFRGSGHAVDRSNVVFYRTPEGDLMKLDPDASGPATRIAQGMFATRPRGDCSVQLLVDERLIHGVMSCPNGPAEIARVSKNGGTPVVVARATNGVSSVQQTESDLFFVAERALCRLPKVGGEARVIIPRLENAEPLHVSGDQLFSVQSRLEPAPTREHPTNMEQRTYIIKRPLSGGQPTDVALVGADLRVSSFWVDAQGVTVATQRASTRDGQPAWEHRLLRFKP